MEGVEDRSHSETFPMDLLSFPPSSFLTFVASEASYLILSVRSAAMTVMAVMIQKRVTIFDSWVPRASKW